MQVDLLPRPHPRLGILADVHVEQAVIGNVEGMAQLGAAGEQEARVAAGLGWAYPEKTLVDFGVGDLRVDALEIHAHATAIESSRSY